MIGGQFMTPARLGALDPARSGRMRSVGGLLTLSLASGLIAGCAALLYVADVLWPRWPEVSDAVDAPPLPIVISGVVFNVPPAAIRVAIQRRPGTQERIDLVYRWPALTPSDPVANPTLEKLSSADDRIFVTIAAGTDRLPMAERLKAVYPRYVDAWPIPGPAGLTLFAFRDNSPYRGEDLAFDRAAPEHFLARCSRDASGPIRAICLAERQVGNADVTLRFPRDWIVDWRGLANGFDRLIAQLHPLSG
jgi:hypothetical protein